ncbi:hypothetical protein B0J12DRAFT_389201 [Macrophomina phaseolina]|uniref:Uncharacterized protein n=1 Tax=Macrophomina phaseolina TaxID=35725 RepID=A0ABQ8FSL0_9PEZI|nr:hypothetical protein B0J12DRAFT_389201 [Macrophomina phaseolina]
MNVFMKHSNSLEHMYRPGEPVTTGTMCTKGPDRRPRHATMQFDLIAHLSLPSFLSSRHQLKQALKKMEISQTTFVGPPTPEGARENVTMAILPDLFVTFISPEPKVNPHYEQVKKESEESMRKTLWKNLSEQEVEKRCAADFCFFSAIMCPDVDKEKFRTVCDWIYWVSLKAVPRGFRLADTAKRCLSSMTVSLVTNDDQACA